MNLLEVCEHHEKRAPKGCLGNVYVDDILPSYVGIIIDRYKYKDTVFKQPV